MSPLLKCCAQSPNQKLLVDRLLFTPPFTALTLFSVSASYSFMLV